MLLKIGMSSGNRYESSVPVQRKKKEIQAKYLEKSFYQTKTNKFNDRSRETFRLNMLFNKMLSNSLDTTTSGATKSNRNI